MLKNIFADIPQNLNQELFETILWATSFRMERIVSYGHCSPKGYWYDQDENEWVILLKGSAGLLFENNGETIKLIPGDYVHIKKHCRHRVEWTDTGQETIWLAVHYT
mgnify:CR=1 FL=1